MWRPSVKLTNGIQKGIAKKYKLKFTDGFKRRALSIQLAELWNVNGQIYG